MLSFLLGALAILPLMMSCSGEDDSKSPFGSLPKVYGEYLKEYDELKEKAKDIKTEKEKAEYLEKTNKLLDKWTAKIETAAKKLDGKVVEFGEGQFVTTQPISFQFSKINQKDYTYVVFDFNGSAETAEDIAFERNYYTPAKSVRMVGYDAEGQQLFYERNVGSVEVIEKDDKSFIPKGTPIKLSSFQFGGANMDMYRNATVLKFEVVE